MLKAGQRVVIDFGVTTLEGIVTLDCEDWAPARFTLLMMTPARKSALSLARRGR